MNEPAKTFRDFCVALRQLGDVHLQSVPTSRGSMSNRWRRPYVLPDATPLTDEQVRSLPVANRFSA